MLVLSRKPGERIMIGDDIVVTVVRFHGGTVRLGIEAPREFPVIREELSLTVTSADPDPIPQQVDNHQAGKQQAGKQQTDKHRTDHHRTRHIP